MRIALIHAVSIAMEPIRKAFSDFWSEAEIVNILEDSLERDRARLELSIAMHTRIQALIDYALLIEAKGILFTCSAFGAAIEPAAAKLSIPVLKPNEAMFQQAMKLGRRIGMLATFPPAVAGMEDEFRAMAGKNNVQSEIISHCIPEAKEALVRGDSAEHNRLIAESAKHLGNVDAIMLAHFSTARAKDAVMQITDKPVLTSPQSAVNLLRRKLEAEY